MRTSPKSPDNRSTIFLDRDGTLNRDPGYISSLDQFELFDDTLEALGLLADHNFCFVIVTNQSGIARGRIRADELDRIHAHILRIFHQNHIPLLGVYHCPHHPEDGCLCRKPEVGMFLQAAKDHSINLNGSYIIGDSESDMVAGKALSMLTVLVRSGNGESAEKALSERGIEVDFVGDTLSDCADFILSREWKQ